MTLTIELGAFYILKNMKVYLGIMKIISTFALQLKQNDRCITIKPLKIKQTLNLIRNEKIKGVKTIIEEAK